MYKALVNNRIFYVAINSFKYSRKETSPVYCTGVHYRKTFDGRTLFIVVYCFRLIIELKNKDIGCSSG